MRSLMTTVVLVIGLMVLATFRCRNGGGQEPALRSGRRCPVSSVRFTYSVFHPVSFVLRVVRRRAGGSGAPGSRLPRQHHVPHAAVLGGALIRSRGKAAVGHRELRRMAE